MEFFSKMPYIKITLKIAESNIIEMSPWLAAASAIAFDAGYHKTGYLGLAIAVLPALCIVYKDAQEAGSTNNSE